MSSLPSGTPAGFPPLRAERLMLRPLRPADAGALHRLVNDWEVAKALARVPFPYPRPLADQWIAATAAQMATGEAWHLAIIDVATEPRAGTGDGPDDGTLLGCVGLTLDRDRRGAELGYWVGRRFWGQGIGAAAAGLLARWGLGDGGPNGIGPGGIGIHAIRASTLSDNARSCAVLRRLGFREVGEGMQSFLSRGGPLPVRLFRAVAADLAGPTPGPATLDLMPDAVPDPGHDQPRRADRPPLPAAGRVAPAGGLHRQPEAAPPRPPAARAEAPRLAVPPPTPLPLLLVAACALVDTDGRVLLARRPEGKPLAGLWEFPGGKLAPGETPEAALIRELKEELDIDVTASCLAPFSFASHAYEGFHLLMPLYLCRRWSGTLRAVEGQALAWVRPQRLADHPMPPADKPLVAMLRDFL